MISRRRSLPLATTLLATLLAIIFISLAQAKPLVNERADSTSSFTGTTTAPLPSAQLLSSSNQSSASPSRTKQNTTKIPSTTHAGHSTAVPTENARMDSSPVSGPLATFCKDFVRQCYKSALDGQTGDVVVSHACMRNGGKSSTSFTYICTRNGQRITAAVLKAMGQAYHRPSTTTTIDNFSVVTELVEEVATDLETTTRVTTFTDATLTNTLWASVVNVEVETIPSTVLSTNVISETLSLTSTATQSVTTTATTLTTSTETEVILAGGAVPVYQVVISEDEDGLQRRAPSTFCLAYKIACQSECAKVSSRVSTWICRSELPKYSLACECRNGKRETQHALEAVAEDRKIRSITRVGSSTVYSTSTRTTTLLTEVLNTKLATRTTSVDRTTTFSTTTSTTVVGETTSYTSLTSTVETETTTIFPTTVTSTTSTTLQITATTQTVLASTGYIHAFDSTTGSDLGTIVNDDSLPYAYLKSIPAGTGIEFMAVRDDPTGLYKLVMTESPGVSLIQVLGSGSYKFSSGTADTALIAFLPYTACGTAGTAPGPPDPTLTTNCEAYVFSPLAFDQTPGATTGTVSLRPIWFNPVEFPPANTSGAWAHLVGQDVVRHVADKAFYISLYPNQMVWFSLRFPFAS